MPQKPTGNKGGRFRRHVRPRRGRFAEVVWQPSVAL